MQIDVESSFELLEKMLVREVGVAHFGNPTLPPVASPPADFYFSRRNAWWFLHSYTGCDPDWLKEWESTIPTGRCNCKEGYRKILESFAWDFTSPEKFFESGVELHNLVNQKLIDQGDTTKKIVTLDEAYSIWRNGDGSDETMDG
jgi:hypothetical protein